MTDLTDLSASLATTLSTLPVGSTGTNTEGAAGAAFAIAETFSSIAARDSNTTVQIGQFALMGGTLAPTDEEYGKLYLKTTTGWSFVVDMSVAGIQGPAGPAGPAGADGTNGTAGTAGAAGTNGADGADADPAVLASHEQVLVSMGTLLVRLTGYVTAIHPPTS